MGGYVTRIHYLVCDYAGDAFYLFTRDAPMEQLCDFATRGGVPYKWSRCGVMGRVPHSFEHLFRSNSAIRVVVDNDDVNVHGGNAIIRGTDPFVVEAKDESFNGQGDCAIAVSRAYEKPLLKLHVKIPVRPHGRGSLLVVVSAKHLRSAQVKGLRVRLSQRQRYETLERDDFTCQLCGANRRSNPKVELEMGHKNAVANGGTTELSNIHTLCKDCNRGQQRDES